MDVLDESRSDSSGSGSRTGSDSDDISDSSESDAGGQVVAPTDNQAIWSDYHGNADVFNFSDNPGLAVDVDPADNETVRPIDLFRLFVTDDMIELMVTETNRYGDQSLNRQRPLQQHSRLHRWKPVDDADIWEFLAILLYMGIQSNPSVADYWSSDLTTRLFEKFSMSRDRFQLIFRHWHFSNNETAQQGDRLSKVSPLFDLMVRNCQAAVTPAECLTVDETMIPWRGRLGIRQYIPGKRHKFGVKMYKLCEPTGYTYSATIYGGRSDPVPGLSQSESVVARLCVSVEDSGRQIFADNFFTGMGIASYLLDRQLYITGTLRQNRRNLPKTDVVKAKLAKGAVVCRETAQGVAVCKWKDKRDVLMISTKHSPTLVETGKSDRHGNAITKPDMVIKYNAAKVGIDLSDQLSSYQTVLRRTLFWYKKIALEILFGIGVVNAYVLYRKGFLTEQERKSCTVGSFKKQLLGECLDLAKELRPAVGDQPGPSKRARFQTAVSPGHFLLSNPPRESGPGKKETRRRCGACYKAMVDITGDPKAARNRAKKVLTFCPGCDNKYYCTECFFREPIHKSQN